VALIESEQIVGPDFDNGSLIYFPCGDVPGRDQVA
jgi:hypothetical protein